MALYLIDDYKGYALDEDGFVNEPTGGGCSVLRCDAVDSLGEQGTLIVHRNYSADIFSGSPDDGGVFVGWYSREDGLNAWEEGDDALRWARVPYNVVGDAVRALLECAREFDSQTDSANDPNGYTTYEVQS